MSDQVLHVDFISLDPNAGKTARQQIAESATALAELDDVLHVGLIEGVPPSDFELAVFFLLSGFTALEPFGTDERYSRFLQGAVAPHLRAFAGADVRLEADLPDTGTYATCLALAAPERTYDWEVRDALNDWTAALDDAAGAFGLAVGEKQRYRGVAIAFTAALRPAAPPPRFGASLVSGPARTLA